MFSECYPEPLHNGLYAISISPSVFEKFHHYERDAKTAIRVIHHCVPDADLNRIYLTLTTKLEWSDKDAKLFVSRLEGLRHGKNFHGGDETGMEERYNRWGSSIIPDKYLNTN